MLFIILNYKLKQMKTYKELLDKLLTLDECQLNSKIIVIYKNEELLTNFNFKVLKENLCRFKDFDGTFYLTEADDEESKWHNSEIIVEKNYPVITTKN